MTTLVEHEFDIRETVYLKTDKDQTPRIITAYKVCPGEVMYELSQGTGTSWHYDFEMSQTADVMMSSTN